MQDLRSNGWLEERSIDIRAAFQGTDASVNEVLFISHRWEKPTAPDSEGAQFRAIQAYLEEHPQISLVWYDFWCLPQKDANGHDDRSEEDRALFDRTLQAVGDLYLLMRVLILLDSQYFGRFWTSFEAWCAMQCPTAAGLLPAAVGNGRYDIVCIHNAADDPEPEKKRLVAKLASLSVKQAYNLLRKPDVVVTNQKDKETILNVLYTMDNRVRLTLLTGQLTQGQLTHEQMAQLNRLMAKREQIAQLTLEAEDLEREVLGQVMEASVSV